MNTEDEDNRAQEAALLSAQTSPNSKLQTATGRKVAKVFEEFAVLFDQKHQDYGPENVMGFGELGVLVRCNDKVARLKNLLQKDGPPRNEPIVDSWKDLCIHAMIGYLVNQGEWE